jgi:DNA (cytosine-5)-methyltransferase 1
MSIRGLSLFAGIGGLDLGARAAGVDVTLATDSDEGALELLRKRDGTEIVAGDLRDLVASGELADCWRGDPPDILFGGPPCTAFSHAGFWLDHKRNGEDPATGLLGAYIDVLRQLRPSAFLMENVPGLAFETHRPFLDSFVNRARRAGYRVSSELLNAADHGVPQRRRRLFVAGVLSGKAPDLSLPTSPPRSAGWALESAIASIEPDEIPKGKYAHLLPRVPPGDNYLIFTKERGAKKALFRYRGRYWSFLLKLDPLAPSPTVPAQRVTWNGPFHWENRHLRCRELARLQSFPDSQPIGHDLTNMRRWLGNAVPPVLGMQVVGRVLESIGAPSLPRLAALAEAEASFEDVQLDVSQSLRPDRGYPAAMTRLLGDSRA